MSDIEREAFDLTQDLAAALQTIVFPGKISEEDKIIFDDKSETVSSLLNRADALLIKQSSFKADEWLSTEDIHPDVLEVRVRLSDGSELNCWAQTDGDFYWKGGGTEMFIPEHYVTHWIPEPPKEQDDE